MERTTGKSHERTTGLSHILFLTTKSLTELDVAIEGVSCGTSRAMTTHQVPSAMDGRIADSTTFTG